MPIAPFALVLAVLQVPSEPALLKVVDRFGGSIDRYSLSVTCGSSKWRVDISSATASPELAKLRGCSGRIEVTSFQRREVGPGGFDRGVIALDIAWIGDPAPSVPPPPAPFRIMIDRPGPGSQLLSSGAEIRLLFKYGDEVYSAPLDTTTMKASVPVPSGDYTVLLQQRGRTIIIGDVRVSQTDREVSFKTPPGLTGELSPLHNLPSLPCCYLGY